MSQLSLKQVTKYFDQAGQRVTVLENSSYDFLAGQSYAISGVSGSGKSTLMHMLAGLEAPTAGVITLNQQLITATDLQIKLGLVFQAPNLIQDLNAWENIALKGLILGVSFAGAKQRALELLQQVGLAHKAYAKPTQLSGGEQQRVAIARALYAQPAFLLADEPTGNLDLETGRKIIDLLISLQQERSMGLIICTHDSYVLEKLEYKLQLSHAKLLIN
ncbi:MAG TPA: ABC transporter ATP-binding protein [Candidatus Babeliales bacterium]|nr:ABC transporter ATP-binding protein [Candidatus Babeliales bacterium]